MSLSLDIVFGAAAAALITLNALLFATVFSSSFRLWPTPSRRSWQHYTFWPLFRGGLSLTLLYATLTAHWPQQGEALQFIVGLLCLIVGFSVTIYGYFDLGLDNTYGADDGLVTKGLYRYSRNPQYVASILGYFGTALANGGHSAAILCGLAILVYLIMPFTEEPWLLRAYGDAYTAYKNRTPRFL
ncbi:MAG: PEMT/PEM2 methyltransferase family protein [Rhodomicrobium sp.]|jgi:protein-S-isoprenylcysteine O-methyltransferase Ste14